MPFTATERWVRVALVLGILIFLNILFSFVRLELDFTEDKRYSLTRGSLNTLEQARDAIYVRVLLDGDFPSGFKRLQHSVIDLLRQFRSLNPNIEFSLEDPNTGSPEEVNEMREKLAKDGLLPINLKVHTGSGKSEQLIFPYAVFNLGERKIAVNLVEHDPALDQEANISQSISQLEYKFVNALSKLQQIEKKNILFTASSGELPEENTLAAQQQLRPFYHVVRADLDSLYSIKESVDLVVVARPTRAFSERNKFILDQYLMRGGKILWMVDALQIGMDSFTYRQDFIPEPLELNLGDWFFQHGVRIEPTLVLDMECARIAQVIGKVGDKPQIELFPWYYLPLAAPYSDHPVVNNIDRILLDFPAKIDTVKSAGSITKTPLIVSSPYSRYQLAPARVGFDILRYAPDASKFDKPHLIMGVLLEGQFKSLYANRPEQSMLDAMEKLGLSFRTESPKTAMIIVSDGDLIRNHYDASTDKFSPVGYSKFEKTTYNGNRAFFLNAVEYLVSEEHILEARGKEFKIRMLDQVRISREKSFWQVLNTALPLVLLLLGGQLHRHLRKKKYTTR